MRGAPWTGPSAGFSHACLGSRCSCPVSVLLRGVHACVQTLTDKTLCNNMGSCNTCHVTLLVLRRFGHNVEYKWTGAFGHQSKVQDVLERFRVQSSGQNRNEVSQSDKITRYRRSPTSRLSSVLVLTGTNILLPTSSLSSTSPWPVAGVRVIASRHSGSSTGTEYLLCFRWLSQHWQSVFVANRMGHTLGLGIFGPVA